MNPEWPGGAQGALCLSFDNLGEAAEIELGADAPLSADATLSRHFTATRVLPALLDALGERDLAATFFVEGLNAELYPDALRAIATDGHEVAYHAWRHEQWGELSAAEQTDNLARGLTAFRDLGQSRGVELTGVGGDLNGRGVELTGMRPPGGQLGAGGVEVLREAGLRYCSPAGAGAGAEDGIALLPFQWRHVDASCVLPPLAPVRERMTGSPDPIDPDTFLAFLEAEIERLSTEGGFATIVLHLFMLDWLGEDRLAALLDLVREAKSQGDLWVAPCGRIAAHVLAHPNEFRGETTLDATSWFGK